MTLELERSPTTWWRLVMPMLRVWLLPLIMVLLCRLVMLLGFPMIVWFAISGGVVPMAQILGVLHGDGLGVHGLDSGGLLSLPAAQADNRRRKEDSHSHCDGYERDT
jgi:hypothetical protein